MELIKTKISGLYLIKYPHFGDMRGDFVKLLNKDIFEELGIHYNYEEIFYSRSKEGVIRGMHFQIPPHDHVKLVSVISGKILDVVLDLRKNSKTYGEVESFEIVDSDDLMIYVPKGLAHGFKSLKDNTNVMYLTSTGYSKNHDRGILWDSFGFDWNVEKPILSERDLSHISFKEFDSPFE